MHIIYMPMRLRMVYLIMYVYVYMYVCMLICLCAQLFCVNVLVFAWVSSCVSVYL